MPTPTPTSPHDVSPTRELSRAAAPDLPGPTCLLAVDLMSLAKTYVGAAPEPASADLSHVLACSHCAPRFHALTTLYRTEPSLEAETAAEILSPTPDTWAGPLVPARVLAADAGGQVIAANLQPGAGCQLSDHSLYIELHCESVRNGVIRCHLLAPAAGKGATGTPNAVLDRFAQQQYMVELSGDDPYGACGFDTILQWDTSGQYLISPPRVLAISGHATFDKLELTHLRAIPGYDME